MTEFVETIKLNFVGRICTILTQPVSFPFKDAMQHAQFFTGKVEAVDTYGIWIRHIQANTISFYQFPVVGIVEEQTISQDDPRAAKIVEELKKKEAKHLPLKPHQQFIPVDSLTKMVKDLKNNQ